MMKKMYYILFFIHLDKPNLNFIIPRNPYDMCTET